MILRKNKQPDKSRQIKPIPRAKQATVSYYSNIQSFNKNVKSISDKKPTLSKRLQRSRKVRQLLFLLVLVGIMFGLVYVSTLQPDVKIVIFKDNKTVVRDQQSYVTFANSYIKRSVVNRSKLLFDRSGLEAEMKRQFPEIATITISVSPVERQPVITLETTRPVLVLVSGVSAVVVGNNGVALANLNDINNNDILRLPVIEDQTGLDVQIGKPVLTQEQTIFISTVVEQLQKQSLTVDRLTIPASPYDIHVRIAGEQYFVKFNMLEDAKQQSGSFIALKKLLEKQNKKPNEYVDVRAGERVFYK